MKNTTQNLSFVLTTLACILTSTSNPAAEIRKANNGDPLDSGLSWFGGIAPTNTDVALWDGDSGTGMASPSTNLSWGGIRVLDMNQFTGGNVQFPLWIQTLALGDAGIDLSASQHDVDFISGFVSLETNQVWHVGPGRVLTLDSENGAGTGGLWKVGPGILRLAYDYTPASHLNNAAPLGLAGGTVRLDGSNPHAEVVGSTLVYGDATRVERWNGSSTLVLNGITRYVGGTVDFTQPGIALTSTGNDASAGDGILGGWATVNFGQDWAQVAAGGGNQSINAYPMANYSTDFEETNNVSLSSSVTLTNAASFAINSLRFGSDAVLTLGGTTNMYSLTNLSGGILMSGGAFNAAIVSSSLGRTLRGPAGGDLIFHVPHSLQTLSNQVLIADNAACGLTKAGHGTLLLNPNTHNAYAGLTTINGGTLRTGNVNGRRYVSSMMMINPNGTYLHGTGENNLNLTGITVNGGTLNLNARNDSCPALLLANNGTITGYGPGKTFTVGNASTPLAAWWGTIDVALNAPGGLVKTTDRNVLFTQNSTLSGMTRIENGALQVASNAIVSAGSLVIGTTTNDARVVLGGTKGSMDSGGTLSITNLTVASTNLMTGFGRISGGSAMAGNLILDFDHDADFNVSVLGGIGPFGNNLNLVKSGVGAVTLTNWGHFNGIIENQAGTLKIGDTNAIPIGPGKGIVTVTSGTLDLNGLNVGIGGLNGAGIVYNFATLTFRDSGSGVFDGNIVGGNIQQSGSGDQLFRGTNTYPGNTTINSGMISVDADAVLGNGTGPIFLSGGTLNISESRAPGSPISNPIHGGLGFISTTANGPVLAEFTGFLGTGGTLVFEAHGPNTFFNPMFSGAFTTGNAIFIRNIILSNTGVTTFHSGNTNGTRQTYNGVISGDGGFRRSAKSGMGGVTVLSATNTYTGTTLVDNGTLLVNGALGTNVVTVTNLGVLGGNGTIRGPVLVQNGGTLAPGTSIGRLTLSNALVFADGGTAFVELSKNGSAITNDFVTGLTGVTYGGTLSLTNLADALAAGDSFKLFSAMTYAGAFTNIVPAMPGAGLVWDTSSLITNGTLRVTAAASPIMENTRMVGTNFFVSGSGGTANGTYYVLTSTNAVLPLTNWTYFATNTFDANGNFSFTNAVSAAVPQRFFLLQLP